MSVLIAIETHVALTRNFGCSLLGTILGLDVFSIYRYSHSMNIASFQVEEDMQILSLLLSLVRKPSSDRANADLSHDGSVD